MTHNLYVALVAFTCFGIGYLTLVLLDRVPPVHQDPGNTHGQGPQVPGK